METSNTWRFQSDGLPIVHTMKSRLLSSRPCSNHGPSLCGSCPLQTAVVVGYFVQKSLIDVLPRMVLEMLVVPNMKERKEKKRKQATLEQ